MNESILKALVQLFAIIANVENEAVSSKSRSIVEAYLRQLLNNELVNQYLKLFDEFIVIHHGGIKSDDVIKGRKRTSLNAVKVLQICEHINAELDQEQKVLVLIQLLEFIKQGEEVTERELDFVQTVADAFNVDEREYKNCKAFILDTIEKIPEKDKILLIDNNKDFKDEQIKHICNENLSGNILVLYVASTNMYFFRYVGEDTLNLNSQSIAHNRVYNFTTGSSIRSSKISTIYYGDVASKFLESASGSKIIFTAKDVEFYFKNSANGIQRFNFSEESGQLIGIMGGSGVGKSTLLNVLNGNLKPQSGQILINGIDIHDKENSKKIQGLIGFVPQDDLLIEELTVFQNLYFNAQLCFNDYSKEQITEAVNRVLKDLDLFEIRDLTVGSPLNKFISGGQRKRLNIALELIREPSILFVDEPTSGLSSMDSEMVMDLLKELTLKGKLVIVNIHQPSSDIYKMFDKLLVLDKGGYLIYYGNPIDAIVYFKKLTNHINADESECPKCGNVNPEQLLQIVEAKVVNEYGKLTRNRKVSAKEWNELYREHIESKFKNCDRKEELPVSDFKIPNPFKQFKIFCIRDILSKLTNKQYLLINFLEAPALALLVAFFTMYFAGNESDPKAFIFSGNENLPQYIFMSVIVALFMGLTVSAEEIIKDRKIRQREQFLNLSKMSYINSKVFIMFLISAIQTFSYVIIGNYLLEIKDMTFSYWLMLFTTSCFANMMGLNISSAFNSVVTIYILIPLLLVPQLLLSGVIVKFDKLHKWIASYEYVSPFGDMMASRWAYEALSVDQFKNNEFEKHFYKYEKEMSNAAYRYNLLIPELKSKVFEAQKLLAKGENKEQAIKQVTIVRNEIAKLSEHSKIPFPEKDSLTPDHLTADVAQRTVDYLENIKKYYIDRYNDFSTKKDKQIKKLEAKLGSKEALDKLKQDYHNEKLSDALKNKEELQKFVDMDDHIVQLFEPIFKEPAHNYGRAHFYAPVKKFFGKPFETYWFNLTVIWLMSLVLYITLSFDVLRKIIEGGGNIKLFSQKKKKDRE